MPVLCRDFSDGGAFTWTPSILHLALGEVSYNMGDTYLVTHLSGCLHMETQYNDTTFQVRYEFPPDFRIQISMYGIHLTSLPEGFIRLRHW